MIEEGGDEGLTRGALLSLARLGDDDESSRQPLEAYADFFLKGDFQGAQEASVVALGLAGDTARLDDLIALMLAGEEGRALCGGRPVHPRTRAFAAYSLALLGANGELDTDQCERVAKAYTQALSDESSTFELHVAALLGMGLVPVGDCPEDGSVHVCRGEQLDYLIAYFRDEEKPALLRAHAVPPMARLAVGGAPRYKDIVSRILLGAYEHNSHMEPLLRQSCVIALGILGDADGDEVDVAIRRSLEKAARTGDELSRRLALVALAKVGAKAGTGEDPGEARAACQKELLAKLSRGRGGLQSWAALALGVFGHGLYAEHETVDEELVRALEQTVRRAKSEDQLAATCLGLAILRQPGDRQWTLRRLLEDGDPPARAFAAIALGLAQDEAAREPLRELVRDPATDVQLVWGAGLALRLLHDDEVTGDLLDRLGAASEPSQRRVLVSALALSGDPRAVEPLCGILLDSQQDPELRAAVAMALGTLCSEEHAGWTARLSTDLCYTSLTWTLASPFADGSGILDWR